MASSGSRTIRTQRLNLVQLFCGPAVRALEYAYSYAFTHTGDVVKCLEKLDVIVQFDESEIKLLSKTRSSKNFTIPLLYKMLKFCCPEKLRDFYSPVWSPSGVEDRPTTLESSVTSIYYQYMRFTSQGVGNVDTLVFVILAVIRYVGEQLAVSKWKQQYESLKKAIEEIVEEPHPAMDIKERVANAARVESDVRCQHLAKTIESMAKARCNPVLTDQEDEWLSDLPYDLVQVTSQNNQADLQYEMSDRPISPEELLEVMEQQCKEAIDGKKICCISGDHGTGKSTLAAKLPMAFLYGSETIKNLLLYDHVLFVSGKEIEQTSIHKWIGTSKADRNDLNNFIDDFWSVTESFLPCCCAKYGVKCIGQYLSSKRILFIVDDVDELSEKKIKELVLFIGQMKFESCVLLLGLTHVIEQLKYNFISYSTVQHLHLKGLHKDRVLETLSQWKETVKSGKKKVYKTLKDSIKPNMNRLGFALQFSDVVRDIVVLWKTRAALVKEVFCVSELLWQLILKAMNNALEVDLDKDFRRRKLWLRWLHVVGENALHCLKAKIKLNEACYLEIKESAEKLFRAEAPKVMETLFKSRLVFDADSLESFPRSTSLIQLEYLSSFYVSNKLREDSEVLEYLPNSRTEAFIALVAGHIRRWEVLGTASELESVLDYDFAQEIIQSLTRFKPGKSEDTQFLMKLATEFRCSHKMVQLMVNVTEYPEEWDLQLFQIHQRTLEVMLQHVAPVRIILRTDHSSYNYELLSVLKFLGQVPISVWLESKKQFEYGSNKSMDKILRPFLTSKVVSKIDLFSGCLSRITMMDFPDYKCMSYITMLALRIEDEASLQTALSLPSHLPHILWYELKIDMVIDDINLTALPNMKIEMFDVYLKDLDDLCVPKITGLLTKLHKRYSGIHLDHTTLSPESIYTLLKELKRRGIALCATKESIDKYRRWYYPLLSELPKDCLLTDAEVKKILGFEDRHFYSDHKITSSTFVKSIDAWNLTSYLEELKEIKYFVYQADNIAFVKTLEGTVTTEIFGDVQIDTTGTIL